MAATSVAAQTAPAAAVPGETVEADPIRCWWRTSAGSVRVGEAFSLVLTCAAIENDTVTVVPDHSRLDPAALQLPPLEVIGGQRAQDRLIDQRRFFQYVYTLRLLSGEYFARDVKIPALQVGYHLLTQTPQGESLRGRDQTYVLPVASVRVTSLVPVEAADIRDAPGWTFEEVASRQVRARLFFVAGGVLAAVGALLALATLVRLILRSRRPAAVGRPVVSSGAVLRGVGRELAQVQRGRNDSAWTNELAARALAAIRVAGAVALGRPVGQTVVGFRHATPVGQFAVRTGWVRPSKVLVSGSVTADDVARDMAASVSADGPLSEGRRQALEDLASALRRFTSAQFSREGLYDETSLDDSLTAATRVLRRLRLEQVWPVRMFRSATQFATDFGARAWSR